MAQRPITNDVQKNLILVGYGDAYTEPMENGEPIPEKKMGEGMFSVSAERTPFGKLIPNILEDSDGWNSNFYLEVEPDHPAYELLLDSTTPAVKIWNKYFVENGEDEDDA